MMISKFKVFYFLINYCIFKELHCTPRYYSISNDNLPCNRSSSRSSWIQVRLTLFCMSFDRLTLENFKLIQDEVPSLAYFFVKSRVLYSTTSGGQCPTNYRYSWYINSHQVSRRMISKFDAAIRIQSTFRGYIIRRLVSSAELEISLMCRALEQRIKDEFTTLNYQLSKTNRFNFTDFLHGNPLFEQPMQILRDSVESKVAKATGNDCISEMPFGEPTTIMMNMDEETSNNVDNTCSDDLRTKKSIAEEIVWIEDAIRQRIQVENSEVVLLEIGAKYNMLKLNRATQCTVAYTTTDKMRHTWQSPDFLYFEGVLQKIRRRQVYNFWLRS